MGFWTLIPITGVGLFLGRRLDVGAAMGVVFAVSLTLLVLFAGGLLDLLRPAALLVLGGGLILFANEVVRWLRRHDRNAPPVFAVVLFAAAGAFWLLYGQTHFYFYDEYAHWGIYLQELIARDAFWPADTNAMHVRYPPGSSLLQYLFSRFLGPVEGNAFLAQFVLVSTPMLLLLHNVKWRQWTWIVGVLALVLLALTSFSPGVSSLYVEHVLGAWFAGGLLCFVLSYERTPSVRAFCALPLTTLVVVKGSGLVLALAAAGIMAVASLHRVRPPGSRRISAIAGALQLTFIVLLPAIVCAQLWNWNRDRVGAPLDTMSAGAVVERAIENWGPLQSKRASEITRRYVDVLTNTQLGNNEGFRGWNEFTYVARESFAHGHGLTAIGIIAAFSGWCVLVLATAIPPRHRSIWGIVFIGVLLTSLGYLASLYVMYLVAFGERGELLPSYTRYANTMSLAMLLITFAPLLPGVGRRVDGALHRARALPPRVAGYLFFSGLVALYVAQRPPFYPVIWPNLEDETRQEWEPLTRNVRAVAGDARIWVYLDADDGNGFAARVVKYLLTPARVTTETSNSFWEEDPVVILRIWSQFDYVWLPLSSDHGSTLRQSTSIPLDSTPALLRVTTDSYGRITLEPVVLPDRVPQSTRSPASSPDT